MEDEKENLRQALRITSRKAADLQQQVYDHETEKELILEQHAIIPGHVWQLVKQLEESAPDANNRLNEMIATLLINWGPRNSGRHPVLIDADDQPVAMLVKVLTYYVEATKQKNTFELLVEQYEGWALKVFDTTPAAACEGLKREADELKKDIEENRPPEMCLIEAADVLFYLIYIIRRKGWTLKQLYDAMNTKIEINSCRNWSKNIDGTYSHIK